MTMKRINLYYFIYGVLFWACQYAYSPYLAIYLEEIGASAVFAGFVIGSYGFFQMLIRVPIGIISDRTNRQRVFIIIGNVLLVISSLILLFFKTPIAAFIARLFCGLAASIWICFIVVFQENYRDKGSVVAASRLFSVTSSGRLAGIVIASVVLIFSDLTTILVVCAIISVIVLLMSFKIVDVKNERVLPVKQCLLKAFKNRELITSSILVIFSQMVLFSTVFGYSGKLIAENYSEDIIGIVNGAAVIGMIVGPNFVNKIVIDKLGVKSGMTVFYVAFLSYIVCLPFATSVILMVLLSFIGGVGCGCVFSTLMGQAVSTTEPEIKALAMGVFQSAVGAGVLFGPIVFGVLSSMTSLKGAFLGMAGILVFAIILNYVIIKERKQL